MSLTRVFLSRKVITTSNKFQVNQACYVYIYCHQSKSVVGEIITFIYYQLRIMYTYANMYVKGGLCGEANIDVISKGKKFF